MPERVTEAAISRLMRLFAGLERAHGTYDVPADAIPDDRGKIRGEAVTKREPVTAQLWERHLNGERGLGILPLRDDSKCWFAAIDVDEYQGLDHAEFADRTEGALTVCRSKSGGAHLFAFFGQPFAASDARAMLKSAAAKLGLPESVEIFPKSDRAMQGECAGGWVNMPYFGDSRRRAIREDGSEMSLSEFLDWAESHRIVRKAAADDAPKPKKDYQHPPVEGNRFSYLKSELGRYLQAHPEIDVEQLHQYAADWVRKQFDPPIDDGEWKKWNVRRLCARLRANQERQGQREKSERAKTRDVLLLEAEDEIRSRFTIAADALGQIHTYDEAVGRYDFDDHLKIKEVLKQRFVGNVKPFAPSDTDLKKLLFNLYDAETPKFWEDPPLDCINVQNGVLNVETLTLDAHSPEFLHPNQFDVPWDPKAKCPAMDKFLAEILYEDEAALFYEMLGYSLVPDISLQTAFLLHGPGANGKSQFLAMLMFILGRRNISTVPLHKLEANNFAAYSLLGKLINVEADMTTNRLPGSAFFKSVVGGDEVFVERKYYDGRSVRLHARLFISCNRYPRSSDNSPGFFRKWTVLPFTKKDFDRVDRANRIRPTLLLPKLQAEAPGILNRAVHALRELRLRGEFTESSRMREAKAEFKALTDSVSAWLDENTRSGDKVKVAQQQLRTAYNVFCRDKGYPEMGEKEFSQKVLEYRSTVTTQFTNGKHWFVGIGMRAEDSPYHGELPF